MRRTPYRRRVRAHFYRAAPRVNAELSQLVGQPRDDDRSARDQAARRLISDLHGLRRGIASEPTTNAGDRRLRAQTLAALDDFVLSLATLSRAHAAQATNSAYRLYDQAMRAAARATVTQARAERLLHATWGF
jgi:hypothetical protein